MNTSNVQILVLDFGSQYTQLIARRLREAGVYTEIVPYFEKPDSIKAKNPRGIILSGGPASVYEKDAYKPDSAIFTLGIPILGICYGMQYIADFFGGKVVRAEAQEFGKAVLEILDTKDSKQLINSTQSTLSFEVSTRQKSPQTLESLLRIWEDSVRATHTFLQEKDITEIRKELKNGLPHFAHIIIAKDKGKIVGFIGVENGMIEMLFVAPQAFKKGVGKALIKEALARYLKDYTQIKVDCNEQNPHALGFYEYLGFKKIGRSPKDSAGRAFPIVHLEVSKKNLQKALKRESYAITKAQKQDLEAILSLQKTAFVDEARRIGKMDIEPLTQDLKSLQKESQTNTFLKCTLENGAIIGSVRGYTKQGTTYINKLFVDCAYRGKGVGSALIEALCAALPAKRYEIFTSEKSLENIALYQKLGFVEYKREKPKGFPIKAVFLEKYATHSHEAICESERLILRPYTQADFAELHRILSDKKTMYAWGEGFSKEGRQKWLEKQLGNYQKYGFGIWAIVEKQSGKIIGNAGLDVAQISPDKSKATQEVVEIGYILHRDFWGKGYGIEAARACAKYAFEVLELNAVYCLIKKDNLASVKVAHKLEMQEIGEQIKIYKGKKMPHCVFELKKNMWQTLENSAQPNTLFKGVKQDSIVWMSHADKVESIPQGFKELAKSGNTHYCAIADSKRKIYALQFHPEVVHSECGGQMLQNFAIDICGADTSWNMRNFAESEIAKLRQIVGVDCAQSANTENTQSAQTLTRCAWATDKDEVARKLYEDYHDTEWGMPLHDERKLFEFLLLESFQAGLSWITILKKREHFREAFDGFDYHKIAAYSESKIESLMQNEGIIRNRAKIESAIINAKAFLKVQKEFGSFDKYIWGFVEGKPIINNFESIAELPASTPLSDTIAKDLKKRGFKFVGSTTIYAFMQSVGIVNDHLTSCFKRTEHSALGNHSADFENFESSQSSALASPPKFSKNHESNTANLGMLDSNNLSRQDKARTKTKNSKAEAVEMRKGGFQGGGEGSLVSLNDRADNAESVLYRSNAMPSKVLCAVSGGVDSSVVAALLYRAIGENLIPVFVDTGLLRKGEREAVEKMFRENLKVPLITADASELFLKQLKGVLDPERKRKIIGETFIEVFEKEAKKHNAKGEIKFLAQGTLYPDVIESVSVKGPSKTIKSHHNVGGLPEWMKFELIEPLRELFKDEVRALGRELGMPESMLMRHPFPGPGLAIRIMGEVNKADLDLLREADSIFIEELHKAGLYDKVWQAFCVLLNVRSVGVMGDNRTYDNTICVRAVEALDGMTATFAHLPHDFLENVSNRIINEVEGINRVVYDITSKPPGTIEWE